MSYEKMLFIAHMMLAELFYAAATPNCSISFPPSFILGMKALNGCISEPVSLTVMIDDDGAVLH